MPNGVLYTYKRAFDTCDEDDYVIEVKQKRFKKIAWFHPITFTFCENSSYERENKLEVEMQNIAGSCQQTLENKKFVDISAG